MLYMQLLETTEMLCEVLTAPEGKKPLSLNFTDQPPYWDPLTRETAALEVLDRAGRNVPGIYAAAILYHGDRRPWLRSENHLFVWPFQLMDPRRYIDLDAYMTPEELANLSTLVERIDGTSPYTMGETRETYIWGVSGLDLSKLERAPELNRTECSAASVLRRCAERCRSLPKGEKISLSCDADFVVKGDEAWLERVFDNLILNALRHCGEGGVRIVLEGDRVTVENDGEPIPTDRLNRLWDAFYRGNGARDREGYGLGLAIVSKILDLHRFSYGIQNLDDGVRFWVRLRAEKETRRLT